MTATIIHLRAPEPAPVDAIREPALIEITGAPNGYRVWILDRAHFDFATLSNASRCASAFAALGALGLLDCVQSPESVLHAQLTASVAHEVAEAHRRIALDADLGEGL